MQVQKSDQIFSMTPGHGYLEALVADNVTVTRDPILKLTERGIVTKTGSEYDLDIVVCATGFDTSYRPSFSVYGLEGRDLREEWSDEPRSYLSVAVSGYPNYFSTHHFGVRLRSC